MPSPPHALKLLFRDLDPPLPLLGHYGFPLARRFGERDGLGEIAGGCSTGVEAQLGSLRDEEERKGKV